MTDCIFCDIINGKKPGIRIYEDEKTVAILDIYPIAKGHTLVIPKIHSRNLFDIQEDDMSAVGITVRKVANVLKQELDCDGINIFQGNERAALQEVFHTHFHVLPRWFDDKIVFGAQRERLREDPSLVSKLKQGFQE
ncbi:MAG: HIT family protein [Candidatus Heimdallarchaeota archaeon]|nr:MAG: HIT family protein [Candidatus Heimdallarchaeota archaeon]